MDERLYLWGKGAPVRWARGRNPRCQQSDQHQSDAASHGGLSSGQTARRGTRLKPTPRRVPLARLYPCFSFAYCQSALSTTRIESPTRAARPRVNATYPSQNAIVYLGGFANPTVHVARTSSTG